MDLRLVERLAERIEWSPDSQLILTEVARPGLIKGYAEHSDLLKWWTENLVTSGIAADRC